LGLRTNRSVSGKSGLTRLWAALRYSLQGLKATFCNEPAFRQECYLAVVLIPLAFYLGANGMERAMLIGAWLLVMIVELLNSGLEAVVDRFGDEYHALSGIAKDAGSAAVLLSLLAAVLIWVLVLIG